VVKHEVEKQVPGCTVLAHLSYDQYLRELQICDFFVNPYPYGNMNTLVDSVIVGLEGICVSGRQPHASIDPALFNRLKIPNLYIENTLENYPKSIAEQANKAFENRREKKLDISVASILNEETDRHFDDIILQLQKSHPKIVLSPKKLIKI
jgi:predicted O-linked N-acetylglucosamine transferase (SPINDLY family)